MEQRTLPLHSKIRPNHLRSSSNKEIKLNRQVNSSNLINNNSLREINLRTIHNKEQVNKQLVNNHKMDNNRNKQENNQQEINNKARVIIQEKVIRSNPQPNKTIKINPNRVNLSKEIKVNLENKDNNNKVFNAQRDSLLQNNPINVKIVTVFVELVDQQLNNAQIAFLQH